MATPTQIRDVAYAICTAITGGDCVMANSTKTFCNAKNCRIITIARKAIASAKSDGHSSKSVRRSQ